MTAPGKIRLLLNDIQGVQLWVDDKLVSVSTEIPLELERGVHTLTFRVQGGHSSGLRVEVADAPGSSAHAQPVGGK
jgi:hypothetical protein